MINLIKSCFLFLLLGFPLSSFAAFPSSLQPGSCQDSANRDFGSAPWSSPSVTAEQLLYNGNGYPYLYCIVEATYSDGKKYTQHTTASYLMGCPSNSTLSGTTCTCNASFAEVSGACVVTANTPADIAKAAAIAAGHSPAAAQAAFDAVNSHPEISDSAAAASLGRAAATSYGYGEGAGMPASSSAALAASAAQNFADSVARLSANPAAPVEGDLVVASSSSTSAAQAVASTYAAASAATRDAQLASNIAAGVLTAGAMVGAVLGAAPIAVALASAAAVHAAIIGANIDFTNNITSASVQSAATAGIKSGATPLQVTLGVQAAASAAPAAGASAAAAAAAGAAAMRAFTDVNGNYVLPASPDAQVSAAVAAGSAAASANNAGLSAVAQTAAGDAAAGASVAGASPAGVVDAGVAAGVATSAGYDPAASYAAGVAAAASAGGLSVAGNTAAAIKSAGSGTSLNTAGIEGLLSKIAVALGYGVTPSTSALEGVPLAEQTKFNTDLAAVGASIKAAESTDEASLLNFFVLPLPSAGCTPTSKQVHGINVTLDYCTYSEKIRELLAWLFAIFGGYTIYETIFRSKS